MEKQFLITFESTHHAMACETLLAQKGLQIKIIPTPRAITLSCGLSIVFSQAHLAEIEALTLKNVIRVKGVYEMETAKTAKLLFENSPLSQG